MTNTRTNTIKSPEHLTDSVIFSNTIRGYNLKIKLTKHYYPLLDRLYYILTTSKNIIKFGPFPRPGISLINCEMQPASGWEKTDRCQLPRKVYIHLSEDGREINRITRKSNTPLPVSFCYTFLLTWLQSLILPCSRLLSPSTIKSALMIAHQPRPVGSVKTSALWGLSLLPILHWSCQDSKITELLLSMQYPSEKAMWLSNIKKWVYSDSQPRLLL